MNKETQNAQTMCASARMMRAIAPMLTIAALTSGCASTVGSETERAICDELRRDLPTWSTQDTTESKRQGADFLDTFEAVCPKNPPVFGSFLGGAAYG